MVYEFHYCYVWSKKNKRRIFNFTFNSINCGISLCKNGANSSNFQHDKRFKYNYFAKLLIQEASMGGGTRSIFTFLLFLIIEIMAATRNFFRNEKYCSLPGLLNFQITRYMIQLHCLHKL